MNAYFVSVVMLSVAIALTAGATDAKIGYVNVQKAVQSSTAGLKAKAELEADFNRRKKDLDKKKAEIESTAQDLEKKKTVSSEEVLNKKQNQISQPILEKMKKVIDQLATEKSYTMILDRNDQNILFAQKETDLTTEAVKAFEKL